MKTKLHKNPILAFVAIICISLTNFSVKAQTTIAFNTDPAPPTTGNAGDLTAVSVLYTLNAAPTGANAGGTIQLLLNLVDTTQKDQYGNDLETAVSGGTTNITTGIPEASSPTAYSISVNLGGGNTTPSANLPATQHYVLRVSIYEHAVGNDWNWKDSKSTPITINAGTTVTYSIDFTDYSAITKTEGSTFTETVKYTGPGTSQIMFRIQRLTTDPWNEETLPGTDITLPGLPATAPGVFATQDYTATIPAETLANYPLGTNQSYKVFAVLQDEATYGWMPQRKDLIISPALGTSSFNKQDSNLISQNPVKGNLVLNNTIDFKSVVIYDLSGKAVLKAKKENSINGIDISNLVKGVYVINTDNNIKTKFIKE